MKDRDQHLIYEAYIKEDTVEETGQLIVPSKPEPDIPALTPTPGTGAAGCIEYIGRDGIPVRICGEYHSNFALHMKHIGVSALIVQGVVVAAASYAPFWNAVLILLAGSWLPSAGILAVLAAWAYRKFPWIKRATNAIFKWAAKKPTMEPVKKRVQKIVDGSNGELTHENAAKALMLIYQDIIGTERFQELYKRLGQRCEEGCDIDELQNMIREMDDLIANNVQTIDVSTSNP